MKHLNMKLHHFNTYVEKKEVSIQPIKSEQQIAYYLTKLLKCRTVTTVAEDGIGMAMDERYNNIWPDEWEC